MLTEVDRTCGPTYVRSHLHAHISVDHEDDGIVHPHGTCTEGILVREGQMDHRTVRRIYPCLHDEFGLLGCGRIEQFIGDVLAIELYLQRDRVSVCSTDLASGNDIPSLGICVDEGLDVPCPYPSHAGIALPDLVEDITHGNETLRIHLQTELPVSENACQGPSDLLDFVIGHYELTFFPAVRTHLVAMVSVLFAFPYHLSSPRSPSRPP